MGEVLLIENLNKKYPSFSSPSIMKKGRSIVLSTLLTILGFTIYLAIFTIVIPYIPGCEGYVKLLSIWRIL